MRITLDKNWTKKLVQLPESGMGYQNVRVTLTNGDHVEAVALNAQILQLPDGISPVEPKDIKNIELATED